MALGGPVGHLGEAQRPGEAVGQLLVDGDGMGTIQPAAAATLPVRGGHAPPTIDSRPVQYGARSSRLSTLPAPDLGSGSVLSSMRLGIL